MSKKQKDTMDSFTTSFIPGPIRDPEFELKLARTTFENGLGLGVFLTLLFFIVIMLGYVSIPALYNYILDDAAARVLKGIPAPTTSIYMVAPEGMQVPPAFRDNGIKVEEKWTMPMIPNFEIQ